MGIGEFGGGGSVKWRIEHHEPKTNRPKRLAHRPGDKPGADEVCVGDHAEGHDPISVQEIGDRTGMKKGFFKVTLHGVGSFYVEVVDRQKDPKAPSEIVIEW
jgi:hypothetical protein